MKFPEFEQVSTRVDEELVACAKILVEAASQEEDGPDAAQWIPLLDALGRFAKIVKGSIETTAPVLQLHTQTQRKQEEPNAADDH
jgi:hypothetical protein